MKTEIDTIKITMTIGEAKEYIEQMYAVFAHFEGAVNAVGQTTIDQLMLDYPAVSNFYRMLQIYGKDKFDDIPW